MKKISGNCLSCKKHMTSSCAVLRDTGKRPNDNDWCYGYTKKKSTPTVDPSQPAMEFLGKELREGRMSVECGGVKVGSVAS